MRFSRSSMKSVAREHIAGLHPHFLAPGLAYTAVVYLLTLLISHLSGYTDYLVNYTAMTQDVLLNNVEPYAVDWVTPAPAALILCAALLLMMQILKVGLMWYCLGLSRSVTLKVRNLFDSFGYFTKVACLKILKFLIYTVSSLFFIFPALLFIYRYCFAEYVLHDHPEYGVIRCLRESARITKGCRRELFVLDLSMLGWYVMRDFLFVSTAYITPYEYAVKCEYYNCLSGWKPQGPETDASPED